MKISDLFDSDAFFHPEEEIKSWIKSSKNYQGEDPLGAETLLIFSTSKQRTWLVATLEMLYCILDDARKENPHINWSMGKNALIHNGNVTLNVSSRDKTDRTGLVDIGPTHKNWLFTKQLFKGKDIESSIKDLLRRAMVG